MGICTFFGIVNLLFSARQVKDAIYQKTKLPQTQQRLIFAGQELEDGKLLNDYSIVHGDYVVCQKYICGEGGQTARCSNDECEGGRRVLTLGWHGCPACLFWDDWEDDL